MSINQVRTNKVLKTARQCILWTDRDGQTIPIASHDKRHRWRDLCRYMPSSDTRVFWFICMSIHLIACLLTRYSKS